MNEEKIKVSITVFYFRKKNGAKDADRKLIGQKLNDNLKVIVDIGGRNRTINLHNLENLSIIEGIPDDIRMADGHPNLPMLIEYFQKVATEYLKEMVLHIS